MKRSQFNGIWFFHSREKLDGDLRPSQAASTNITIMLKRKQVWNRTKVSSTHAIG